MLVVAPWQVVSAGAVAGSPQSFEATRYSRKVLVDELRQKLVTAIYSKNDSDINAVLNTVQDKYLDGALSEIDKLSLINDPLGEHSPSALIMILRNKLPITAGLFDGEVDEYIKTPLATVIGMGVDLWNCQGRTAFQVALDMGNISGAYCVLVVMSLQDPERVRTYTDAQGRNFLHYVASINQTLPENLPARYKILQKAFLSFVFLLVTTVGIDPNAADSAGKTPFYYALAKRVVARVLLENCDIADAFCPDFGMTLYERYVYLNKDTPHAHDDMAFAAQSFLASALNQKNIKSLAPFFSGASHHFKMNDAQTCLFDELCKKFAEAWQAADSDVVALILGLDNLTVRKLLEFLIAKGVLKHHVLHDALLWADEKTIELLLVHLKQYAPDSNIPDQLNFSYKMYTLPVAFALRSNEPKLLDLLARHVPPKFNTVLAMSLKLYLATADFNEKTLRQIDQLITYFRPTLEYTDESGKTILDYLYEKNLHNFAHKALASRVLDAADIRYDADSATTISDLSPRLLNPLEQASVFVLSQDVGVKPAPQAPRPVIIA